MALNDQSAGLPGIGDWQSRRAAVAEVRSMLARLKKGRVKSVEQQRLVEALGTAVDVGGTLLSRRAQQEAARWTNKLAPGARSLSGRAAERPRRKPRPLRPGTRLCRSHVPANRKRSICRMDALDSAASAVRGP